MSRWPAEERARLLASIAAAKSCTGTEQLVLDLADDLTEAVAMLREVAYLGDMQPYMQAIDVTRRHLPGLAALLARYPEGEK